VPGIVSLRKNYECKIAAVSAEVENLKAELEKARQEAAKQRVAAEQRAAELLSVKTASDKHEARLAEVQQELQDAITKCEGLEQQKDGQATELSKIGQEIQEARSETQGAREELRQVRQIADGKPYLLQSVFGVKKVCCAHTSVVLLRRVCGSSQECGGCGKTLCSSGG
jgi:chromosome segregation ATPase